MRRRHLGHASVLLGALLLPAGTVGQLPIQGGLDLEKGTVAPVFELTAYTPGSEASLAVRLTIEPGWHTNSHQPTYSNLIGTEVEIESPPGWPAVAAPTYPDGVMKRFSFADDPISVYEGDVFVLARLPIPADAALGTYPVHVTVTYQACDDRMCLAPVTTTSTLGLTVAATPGGAAEEYQFATARGEAIQGQIPGGGSARGILWFALLGMIGGLILNAMPCVLPVLSLKVFGLVQSAEEGTKGLRLGGLATAAGILLSFLALASAALVARAAGMAVGWGIQFQNPVFVGALAVVMLLFTLNLWGVFEVRMPAALGRVGMSGPAEGIAGHLFTGFFATLMATPCSAPFLGTALGFALTQDPVTTVTMFTAIGVGMSLPYLVLAAWPRAGMFLPKPGAWMGTFKVVMGFFLAATLVWLLFVLAGLVSPVRVAYFEIGLLAVALTSWFGGRAVARLSERRTGPRVALAATVIASVGSVLLLGGEGADPGVSRLGVAPEDRLLSWQEFDPLQAEALAEAGTYVFVDVTADWCFTCKVNEALFLETPEVAAAFEEHGVVAMRADWTRRDDAIGEYLASFGRYGIPFYVLYRPGKQPHMFSELLSKSAIIGLLSEEASEETS